MADYIPFINSQNDNRLASQFYADAQAFRISLEGIHRKIAIEPFLSDKLWLDSCFDGLHHIIGKSESKWEDKLPPCLLSVSDVNKFIDQSFIEKPDKKVLKGVVYSLLNQCNSHSPVWLSVPQLPYTNDSSRHAINRLLAKEAYEWGQQARFTGTFVLPLIFTHSDQLKNKTVWKSKLQNAQTCLKNSGASILWTVNVHLNDDKTSRNHGDRLNALIEFHEDLKKNFGNIKIISGPYWGMNLILWTRGLCDNPAICLATSFQYYIPAPPRNSSRKIVRIALPPLKRLAVVNDHLKTWLEESLSKLDKSDPVYTELKTLQQNFSQLSQDSNRAKLQIAKFYSNWYKSIEKVATLGRSLTLYQDLSSAYVVGSKLPDIKNGEPNNPAQVAKTLMLCCF
jgi:chloramphenicol O-acetyltransferase